MDHLPDSDLESIDKRLLRFCPDSGDMGELDQMLARRALLIENAARDNGNDSAQLEKSLHAGNELTYKLAAYRRMLESELMQANRIAQHRSSQDDDVAEDAAPTTG